jgi:hypothetical protein
MAVALAPIASAAPTGQPRPTGAASATVLAPGDVQIVTSPHSLPALFPRSHNPKWSGVGYNPRWPSLGHNPKWANLGYNPRWNGFQN